MDLTTLERVTLRLFGENKDRGSASNEALLTSLITEMSATVERYLGRGVQSSSRTEYHDIDEWQRIVSLSAWPVSVVTSVSWSTDAATWTAYTVGTDYLNPLLRTDGQIHFISAPVCGPQSLRVIYTGGMAASTAALITAYPELATAVDMQVAHEYQRRLDRGLISSGGITGTGTYSVDMFTPAVQQRLDAFRRPVLGS